MPYASIEAGRARARDYQRTRRAELDTTPSHLRHLDSGPLLALIDEVVRLDGRPRKEVLRATGLDREYFRFRAAGTVSFDAADRWACRLGVPLGSIYPEVWR